MISVNFWSSHPDQDNDDCVTGDDYATMKTALAEFNKPITSDYFNRSVAYIQANGVDVNTGEMIDVVRKNPDYRPMRDDYDDWQREIAMQAGMMGGVAAYNDAMGY